MTLPFDMTPEVDPEDTTLDPSTLDVETILRLANISFDYTPEELPEPGDGLCGIYFLVHGDAIVYVGQSTQIERRLQSHNEEGTKAFDRVFWITVPADSLNVVEEYFIRKFKPLHNRTFARDYDHPIPFPSYVFVGTPLQIAEEFLEPDERRAYIQSQTTLPPPPTSLLWSALDRLRIKPTIAARVHGVDDDTFQRWLSDDALVPPEVFQLLQESEERHAARLPGKTENRLEFYRERARAESEALREALFEATSFDEMVDLEDDTPTCSRFS